MFGAYQFEPLDLSINEGELELKEDETEREQNQRINRLKTEKKNQLINEI